MKRLLWVLPVVLVLCTAAHAQFVPEWEISGGYSYLKANVTGPGSSFNLQGAGGTLTENMNDWFGGRFEAQGYTGTTKGTRLTAQTVTMGPVFSYRKSSRLSPFGDVEPGLIHASAGFLGISESATKFSLAVGGGADWSLNEHVAIRVQGNYLMTRFLNARQDHIQLATGVVIRFGDSGPWTRK